MAWISGIPGQLLRGLAEAAEKLWNIVQSEVCANYSGNNDNSKIKKAWPKTIHCKNKRVILTRGRVSFECPLE